MLKCTPRQATGFSSAGFPSVAGLCRLVTPVAVKGVQARFGLLRAVSERVSSQLPTLAMIRCHTVHT